MPETEESYGTCDGDTVVIDELGKVSESLVRELKELKIGLRIGTIQTTKLLRSARILRRVLKTQDVLLSLRLQ